jgi:hypothetical protein
LAAFFAWLSFVVCGEVAGNTQRNAVAAFDPAIGGASRSRVGGRWGKLGAEVALAAAEKDPGAIVCEAAEAAGFGLDVSSTAVTFRGASVHIYCRIMFIRRFFHG